MSTAAGFGQQQGIGGGMGPAFDEDEFTPYPAIDRQNRGGETGNQQQRGGRQGMPRIQEEIIIDDDDQQQGGGGFSTTMAMADENFMQFQNLSKEFAVLRRENEIVKGAVLELKRDRDNLRIAVRKLKVENGRMKAKMKRMVTILMTKCRKPSSTTNAGGGEPMATNESMDADDKPLSTGEKEAATASASSAAAIDGDSTSRHNNNDDVPIDSDDSEDDDEEEDDIESLLTDDLIDYDDVGDFLLIGGYDDPLSPQYRRAPIVDDKQREHKTIERYMWFKMAELFDDKEAMEKILKSDKVQVAQEAAQNIKNFDQKRWDTSKVRFYEEAQRAKFDQYRPLKCLLIKTDPNYLAVASRDKTFGTGWLKQRDEAFRRSMWDGENGGGKILMKLRKEYAKNHEWVNAKEEKETTDAFYENRHSNWRKSSLWYGNGGRGGGRGANRGGGSTTGQQHQQQAIAGPSGLGRAAAAPATGRSYGQPSAATVFGGGQYKRPTATTAMGKQQQQGYGGNQWPQWQQPFQPLFGANSYYTGAMEPLFTGWPSMSNGNYGGGYQQQQQQSNRGAYFPEKRGGGAANKNINKRTRI